MNSIQFYRRQEYWNPANWPSRENSCEHITFFMSHSTKVEMCWVESLKSVPDCALNEIFIFCSHCLTFCDFSFRKFIPEHYQIAGLKDKIHALKVSYLYRFTCHQLSSVYFAEIPFIHGLNCSLFFIALKIHYTILNQREIDWLTNVNRYDTWKMYTWKIHILNSLFIIQNQCNSYCIIYKQFVQPRAEICCIFSCFW